MGETKTEVGLPQRRAFGTDAGGERRKVKDREEDEGGDVETVEDWTAH